LEGDLEGLYEWRLGGASKMQTHLKALLELSFGLKPPNLGVASAGVALQETSYLGLTS
jgi:hypothetical protein